MIFTAVGMKGQTTKNNLPYSVQGVLLDSLTNEGEPYSTIRIAFKNNPKKPVKLDVTGLNGKFTEHLAQAGSYIISFTSVGKSTVVKQFTLSESNKTVDLGKIFISESSEMLKGVEVVAAKPLVKSNIDKIEYDMKEDPEAQTNNVLEMLRKVPLVTVDGEDNIQVNGSSNFKVYVNNKPNSMMSKNPKDILKNMPASSIKKIEVITDPGAKYDAEGLSGILNIVTDDGTKMEGYTVTLNGGASNRGVNSGAYGTVQLGKFTITGNYSFNHQIGEKSYVKQTREMFDDDINKYLVNNYISKNNGNFQYGSMEGSYEIDSLNLITFSGGLWGYNFKGSTPGTTTMRNVNNEIIYSFDGDVSNKNSQTNLDLGFDYQHSFKSNKDKLLTFSYRLSSNPGDNDNYTYYNNIQNYPFTLNDIHYKTKESTNEHTFQLDYTTPIAKIHTISTGGKYILRLNSSDSNNFYDYGEGFVLDSEQSSKYDQRYDILAGYGEYKLALKSFSFKTGVRYEHSFMNVKYHENRSKDFDANFDNIIPSANLGLKITDTQNIKLAYNMRISRPSIYYLNPFVNRFDPSNISYGNPNLDPEKAHNVTLTYGNFTPKLSLNLSLSYSFVNNSIEQYSFISQEIGTDGKEHNIQNTTYGNIGSQKQLGLSAYINWSLTKTTRFNANLRGSYIDYNSKEPLNISNSGWQGNFWGGLQQTLPLAVKLNINAGGFTKRISLQGETNSMFFYGMNISRSFLKEDRLTISANVQNPFNHYITFKQNKIVDSDKLGHYANYNSYRNPIRRFGFNISYRFGKLQTSVKKAQRSIVNDDLKAGESTSGSSSTGGGGN